MEVQVLSPAPVEVTVTQVADDDIDFAPNERIGPGGTLETSVEKLADDRVILKVVVPAEDVDRVVLGTYKRIADEVKVPGFRKGHVPPRVIDNYVGRERVMAEVQEDLVQTTYPKALDQAAVRPIDSPEMGELDLPEEGQEFRYEAEVPIRPELTLSSWEGLSITAKSAKVTEEEIDEQVDILRDKFATLLPVEGREIEQGDFALISFTGLVEGEEYEGNSVDQFLYEVGSGQMPEEFDTALVGRSAGDFTDAAFDIPESSSRLDFIGKKATFAIEIHEVKRKILPDFDDSFAQNAGFDTTEELRQTIREKMTADKEVARERSLEIDARKALAERLQGEVPEAMAAARTQQMIRDFFNQLDSQGVSPEQYTAARGVTLDDMERSFDAEAKESIAGELALEALFRGLEFEVTEEDLEIEIREFMGEEGDFEKLRERMVAAGIMSAVREQAAQRKATHWLMDNIEIIEPDDEPAGDAAEEAAQDAADEPDTAETQSEDAEPEGE